MQLGLGIDTGGTYTDSVLYDFDSGQVLARAKALTTKHNLTEGILESLQGLPAKELPKTALVSLSTTLATNACVEGKGSRGRLVLFGYDAGLFRKLGSRYGLPQPQEVLMLSGGHGQQGEVLETPDWTAFETAVRAAATETDAFGVAEYWGIRNPSIEQAAKARIRALTGKPVVAAHELSMEINSLRRASTTLLNARLIPLIHSLMDAVKEGMAQMGVHAPVMVVKGDGTLMSEDRARERPVDTLLSGPAASVVGGMELTRCQDALILDIGGTTSDLAVVRGGYAVLAAEGVDVAGWRTGTRAIRVHTIGLGGDSRIAFDKNEGLTVGPHKAAPLAWAAARWPHVRSTLVRIEAAEKWHTLSLAEFFYPLAKPDHTFQLETEEMKILGALEAGPLSLEELAAAIESRPYFLQLERMESQGLIGRIALTPTDLMHVTGTYSPWDTEAARLGALILAKRLNMTTEALIDAVLKDVRRKLFKMISGYLLNRSIPTTDPILSKEISPLIEMGFEQVSEEFGLRLSTPLPIIGIGAPTHIFLEPVAEVLGTRAVYPQDAGVANAVGAITGSILGEETVLIRPRYAVGGIVGYGCHGSDKAFETEDYEGALAWAKETARERAVQQALSMGASNLQVTADFVENRGSLRDGAEGILLETVVYARAVGNRAIYAVAAGGNP